MRENALPDPALSRRGPVGGVLAQRCYTEVFTAAIPAIAIFMIYQFAFRSLDNESVKELVFDATAFDPCTLDIAVWSNTPGVLADFGIVSVVDEGNASLPYVDRDHEFDYSLNMKW